MHPTVANLYVYASKQEITVYCNCCHLELDSKKYEIERLHLKRKEKKIWICYAFFKSLSCSTPDLSQKQHTR